MQARSIHLQKIFEQQIRYQIPLFQRPYVWSQEENWEPLWEDVRALTERLLHNGEVHPHFLGAVVLDQVRSSTGSIETRQVIDGQQRLTTLQILLAALRDTCGALGIQKFPARFVKLTSNDEDFVDEFEDAFKVWPTNRDREDFAATLNAGSVEALLKHYGLGASSTHAGHRIANAYLYFTRILNAWLDGAAEDEGSGLVDYDQQERVRALWEVISAKLLLVVIDLDESDDAQVIFETLNARGTRLLPADLVKNYLFHRAEQEGLPIEHLYEKYWRELDGDFWRHEVKQGRLKRPRIDLFLRHYLTLATNDDVGVGHIFGVFRFYAERKEPPLAVQGVAGSLGSRPELHLQALSVYARVYRGFDAPEPGSRVETFFERLTAIDTTTVYPYLLESFRVLQDAGEHEDLDALLVWLESYLVRRMICGLTPKNYNRLFLDLLRSATRQGAFTAAVTRDFLLGLSGDSGRWPDDDEFRIAWLETPIYQKLAQYKQRMVLAALDRAFEEPKSESLPLPGSLTIEHVLPRSWEAHWPLASTSPVDPIQKQEATDLRNRLLHSFGNLTLITGSLNPSLSHAGWNKKQPELVKRSKLNLNRYFHGVPEWDEAAIQKRGAVLFKKARSIWPHPG